ncbi:hypothetical protein SAMN02745116_00885 [Pilibacter termitis]|uniref:ATPase AAA-type core domain-containing protein n=1 Tax=Pilibacter termitis TaxID=263852 RepID=A0A1T4LZQ2_9ENTE|nr:ATP-binding protein [Pilibacter termitis]SJZ60230.1 hypothetical protein SAMN02745116_00885 [Pilibacter termitis]
MLIEFTFENFKSYKDEAYFSMETGEKVRRTTATKFNTFETKQLRLLKSSLIFGANASGKTTVIEALSVFQNIVLNPLPTINHMFPFSPYKFDEKTINEPTNFVLKFVDEEIVYEYSLAYKKNKVVKETLKYTKNTKKDLDLIFSRENKNIRENQLYLHFLQQENNEHSNRVMKYFSEKIIIFTGDTEFNTSIFSMLEEENNRRIFLEFMNAADFSIVDCEVVEDEMPLELREELIQKFNIPISHLKTKRLILKHRVQNENANINGSLMFEEESQGTKKMIFVALLMLAQKQQQATLLIDEFDSNIHFELAQNILSLFHSELNRGQLVATTHNVELMDCNLRKDQIYLTDKNEYGESTIKSIFDFSTRTDISFSKRYIQGRFGSLPVVDTLKLERIFGE